MDDYTITRTDGRKLLIDTQGYRTLRRTGLHDRTFTEAWHRVASGDLIEGENLRISVNMNRIVGTTPIVKAPQIDVTDPALFARRRTVIRTLASRVIDSHQQMPRTGFVTLVGDWLGEEGLWMIRTAYCGKFVYPQPWDFSAIARAKLTLSTVLAYWTRAAFMYHPGDFATRPYTTTWAKVIESAAKNQKSTVMTAIGYTSASERWQSAQSND